MKICLSSIDHVFLGSGAYPVQFIFFYPRKLNGERMRRALKILNKNFWPLAACLSKEKERYWLKTDGESKLKLEEQNCSEDIPDFNSPQQLAPYVLNIDLCENSPLTKLKLFHFAGGTILSVNIAHCLTDGYSFFYFLVNWAHSAKNISNILGRSFHNFLTAPKHHRKTLWSNRQDHCEIKEWPEARLKTWLFDKTGLALSREKKGFDLKNSKWSILEFPHSQLLSFLENYPTPKDAGLSWHDLLSAQLWKTTAEKWPVTEEYLTLSSAFDFRRVYSKVNYKYFGNAVRACGVKFKAKEVQQKTIMELAQNIRRSTKSIDKTEVESTIAAISAFWKAFKEEGSRKLHVADPDNGLLVTNLSRLPNDKLDFGSGAPTHTIPMTPAPRTAVVTSSSDGFYIRLSEPIC